MTAIRNFNPVRFFIILLLIGILTVLSFFSEFGKNEGTLGNNIILNFLAGSFYVFRFPMHVLFWKYMHGSFFIVGLLINVLFYAVLIETLVSILKKKNF